MVSMHGDSEGNGPGGFLRVDEDFNVVGRWEQNTAGMRYNYDFWYQPRHNVMVSSEFCAPNADYAGFNLYDVAAGNSARQLHFWVWIRHEIAQNVDMGRDGAIPMNVAV